MANNNRSTKCVVALIYVSLLLGTPNIAVCNDNILWEKMGNSDDGRYVLYMNKKENKTTAGNEIFVTLRRELSERGKEDLRRWFNKEKERAEREAGSSIGGDEEDLFNLIAKGEAHSAVYSFDCKGNEYRIQAIKRLGFTQVVRVYDLQKGSTEEKIRDILCKEVYVGGKEGEKTQ